MTRQTSQEHVYSANTDCTHTGARAHTHKHHTHPLTPYTLHNGATVLHTHKHTLVKTHILEPDASTGFFLLLQCMKCPVLLFLRFLYFFFLPTSALNSARTT